MVTKFLFKKGASQIALYHIYYFSPCFLCFCRGKPEAPEKHNAMEPHIFCRDIFMLFIHRHSRVSLGRILRLEFSKHAPHGKRQSVHVHLGRFYTPDPDKDSKTLVSVDLPVIRRNVALFCFWLHLQCLHQL